jgi:small-conductance mechanosensitive channel
MNWFHHLELDTLITADRVFLAVRAMLFFAAGFVLAKIAGAVVKRIVQTRFSRQETMMVQRLVFYSLLGLVIAATLHQFGFKLGVLLGAAGILTVAIGFASQTSASNLISGLFLIAERSFVVGDIITIEGVTGEVLSIDLLSVKLRTFDNLFVRIPNESIIKSQVTNLTRFPIRRLDIMIGVAYKEEISKVRAVLFGVADRNPLCLDSPRPLFIFLNYGDSALELQFSVWTVKENFLTLKNSIQEEIKAAFDEAGIEIPFPHRTLYTGSQTDPFPVRIIDTPRT